MLLIFSFFSVLTVSKTSIPISSHSISFSQIDYDFPTKNTTEEGIARYVYIYSIKFDFDIFFYGNRFWVEGYKDPTFGVAQVFNSFLYQSEVAYLSGQHQDAVVFYQYDPAIYTSQISDARIATNSSHQAPVTFSRLFYNYLPPLARLPQRGLIRVYADEINFSLNWTSTGQGMSTQDPDASAWCFFNGTKVYIYANRCSECGTMNVYIDDDLQDTITLSATPHGDSLVFQSNDLHFGEHKIEVKSTAEKSINIICFLYRPHLIVSFTAVNLLDFNDGTPKYLNNDVQYIEITKTSQTHLQFTRFWLVGPKGSSYGSFNISICHENGDSVYHQHSVNPRSDKELQSVLLYESLFLNTDDI